MKHWRSTALFTVAACLLASGLAWTFFAFAWWTPTGEKEHGREFLLVFLHTIGMFAAALSGAFCRDVLERDSGEQGEEQK